MSEVQDGGEKILMKAFPNQEVDAYGSTTEKGMDLRDYFAAKAMQGLIHHFDFMTFRDDPKRLANWAYDAADEMMKARDRVENSHEVIAEALAKLNKAAEDNGEKL
jgi:hypothetical protein